jgi:hypothetical protein
MSANEVYARVQSRIWQAIAQQDIDVSQIDKATLEQLVNLTTEAALVEVDLDMQKALTAVQPTPQQTTIESDEPGKSDQIPVGDPTDDEEIVLWQGRPFLSIYTEYVITDERVRIIEGLFGKSRQEVELVRIQSIDHTQTMGERMVNIGDVTVRSHDPNNPLIVVRNVTDPEHVHEVLRRAVLKARDKYKLSYREEM